MKISNRIKAIAGKCLLIIAFPLLAFACSDNPIETGVTGPKPIKPASGLRDGVTVLSDDSLAFALFAPGKRDVHLIGDFNDWGVSEEYKLKTDGEGRFWIRIGGLEKGKEYVCQYLVDGQLSVSDPYATLIVDPQNDKYIPESIYPNLPKYPEGQTNNIAMAVSTSKPSFSWTVSNYKVENPDNLVIYELLIRDFTEEKSIKAVEAKLPYLKQLGINAIELMPFNEFEGNQSWGYNPSFFFAPDKAYGTANDYKSFIDKCHANGIAVIMDMVLNHSFNQNPLVQLYLQPDGKVAANNPWFNVDSPNEKYTWGQDFNHESKYTQQFVDSVCSYWMSEYKVDGFRFDFTKGFTNTPGEGWEYDASRIAILKRMTNEIWKRNKDAVVIFEHLTDNKEEVELAAHGIHLWGNMNHNYSQATKGEDSSNDLNWTSYKQRGWDTPKLISYMESHDEERVMFRNLKEGKELNGYDVKNLNTALTRTEAAAVIYMTIPGPKMIWQFGERGYDLELNNDRLGEKPPHWEYMDVPARKHMYDVYSKLIKLRLSNDIFTTTDFAVDAGQGTKKQVLLRSDKGNVCAVANLGLEGQTISVNFEKTGTWKEYFSNNTLNVTSGKMDITLPAGEYKLYIQN